MTDLKVTVYTPDSSVASPVRMLRDMFRDLRASRELAWRLAVRDIRAQYRQAFLGILWAFILPFANAVAWIFISDSGVIKLADTTLPYPVYAFTGTMFWAMFMESLSSPLQQVDAAKGMLTKLNFPREALIISGLYKVFFNAAIKTALLLGVLIIYRVQLGWNILLFPLGLLSLLLIGTAVGLLITPVGLLYTDVGRAIPLLMQFMMFISPVVFPMPTSGWVANLFLLNPLTPVITTCRDWLTGFSSGYLGYFWLVNAAALLLLLFVWVVYRLAMPVLIERMSS